MEKNEYKNPPLSLLINCPKDKDEILCSKCKNIVASPMQCKECKLIKCDFCKPICSHLYSYEPYESNILSSLIFQCDLCGKQVDYSQILKHKNFLCPKYGYRDKFLISTKNMKKQKDEIEEYKLLNNLNQRTILEKAGKKNKISQIERGEIKTSLHKDNLLLIDNVDNPFKCNICNKLFPPNFQSFCCFNCNFNICTMCFFSKLFE